jgi:quercetin dioxygenase-like cupin family protein
MNEVRKYRWSRVYESAEEELESLLRSKDITTERWQAEPIEVFEPHVHDYDKTLWCAEGSIMFEILGNVYSLQPGDVLELPALTMHSAQAGMSGCVCYEARS